MRLYRTAKGTWVGRQDEARKDGRGWEPVDVPTDKPRLLAWLNDHITPPSNDNETPAFLLGRSDAERGMTANPYGSPDLRDEWERGHAFAVASGAASLPSFAVRALSRNGKRK
jgi:hypothetical protein